MKYSEMANTEHGSRLASFTPGVNSWNEFVPSPRAYSSWIKFPFQIPSK